MDWRNKRVWIFIFLILNSFSNFSHSQRIFLPPTPDPSPPPAVARSSSTPQSQTGSKTLVLKTYPDGTKKIVPLEALNFHDDGGAFGGPPALSLYEEPTTVAKTPALAPKSSERLNVAPIGETGNTTSFSANLPTSVDPLAGSTQVAAADPMGGAGPLAADPMGGGSSAPIDPLGGGGGSKSVPPLQTVSGKPAPLVGEDTAVQLGAWDSFFLNAGIGGSLQGQLTSRRVWNGSNRQAYPFTGSGEIAGLPASGTLTGENFTFQPGFRLDVEFGYNFYEWLGIGLQTGIIYNGLQTYQFTGNGEVTLDGYGTIGGSGSINCPADGELVQVPVQLNGILRWPGDVKLRPFIGGGIGAIWQQLDVNNFYVGPLNIQGNYCRSAFQFGWNAQAGLTYTVEPGLDFYGAFKMLSAFMPVIGNYQFSNTYNFAVEVGVQSRF